MIPALLKNRVFRYLFVGGFSYLVEMACLYGLHNGLGLSPTISVAISFWVGFVVAYLLQKFVAFENHDRSKKAVARQLIGYSFLVGWNYLFTLVVVGLFEHMTSIFIVRTIVIIITTLWNYAFYRVLFAPTTKEKL